MITVLLVIHVMIAVALVGVILIQRSEGGGLGLGGGTMGGLMSGRGAGNLLTRTTAILAGTFLLTSMILAIAASNRTSGLGSLLDQSPAPVPAATPAEPAKPAVPATPAAPAAPAAPSAPVAN